MTTDTTRPSVRTLLPFLFFSGLCALIYQVCWLREFRLIFGGSTAASAAVIAIFVGGLGTGGIIIGRRADRHANPLALYAKLEIAIAITAALSPMLLYLIRWIYLSVGGATTLGLAGGTIVRLLLAAAVIGVPTFLMGGTLSAVARAVEADDDRGRRLVAWLYAVNTLGAVVGSTLATFVLIERWGNRKTLWIAAACNIALGIVVALLARRTGANERDLTSPLPVDDDNVEPAPRWFVLLAAAVVGFAFFLMEIVWYRMLSPILGGSVFTFGLILCLILLGIGAGGLVYALTAHRRRAARLSAFATTCLLESVCVMIAYALGDRIAWLATLLQQFDAFGFGALVLGWSVIAGLCILPPAIVSGYQFPLLIALMGTGRKDVGGDVGAVYWWNTVGAIAGSLAGGFFLMPLLSATGCWRLVGLLLMLLGLAAMILLAIRSRSFLHVPAALVLACIAFALTHFAIGPTAAWRHSGIGVGRADVSGVRSRNDYREWINEQNAFMFGEMEGVESCVGINGDNAYAFIVNGKSDGNAIGDAPTQIMSGVLGAILHPNPRSAMVIGLGSGSTAGWLANVPSIERVDCAELEPAILEFARMCTPVNANAMTNPKLHITIGDARELLMANPRRYDLIFSEPSNPYRAGIASLFTREYYESAVARLNDGGLFVQWFQSYDVQSRTVQTVYATLLTTFPYVETWQGCRGDLLLVASKQAVKHDVGFLRNRIAQEEFRVPLLNSWHVNDLEGFYAHYVASTAFARKFAELPGGELNTDDRIVIEFGLARGINQPGRFSIRRMRDTARDLAVHRPETLNGAINWEAVQDEIANFATLYWDWPTSKTPMTANQKHRLDALQWYVEEDAEETLAAWRKQTDEPRGPIQIAIVAYALASAGDDAALKYIDALRRLQPCEADAILGHLHFANKKSGPATESLVAAFERYRTDPWPMRPLMSLTLDLAVKIAEEDAALGRRLYASLREPFSVRAQEERRCTTLFEIGKAIEDDSLIAEAMHPLEPYVPWDRDTLDERAKAYRSTRDPLADRAKAEHDAFEHATAEDLLKKLSDAAPSTRPTTQTAAR